VKRSKQPGEAEAAAEGGGAPSAATRSTYEMALAIGGVTIEPPEDEAVSDTDSIDALLD
jgi:hypothetical protein